MRIIKPKRLRELAERYPAVAESLEKWYQLVRHAHWDSLHDARRVYPHADAVIVESGKTVTVFNIGGNKYRLIVAIHYNTQCVYILDLLTHAEYDKNFWKGSL